MVHLNGRALSTDATTQIEFNGIYAPTATNISPPRRVRTSQSVRGPKPLLPRSLKEALQLAELLSKSKLIPKGFETPETCLVGILYGMEVGLSPIAALQRMAVIDGRPAIWGDAALALVQASGLLRSIKEEIVEDMSTENMKSLEAICTVRREGRTEPITGTFSIEDAKRAGLWQKPGPWTEYPKRMLIMRARAFALRDAFPDVLAGLYLREEFVGKERQAENLKQDRSGDDAEWNAAAAHGAYETNGVILKSIDAQSDEAQRTPRKASELDQTITSGYDFTPDTYGQCSRANRDIAQVITSGYGVTPATHGVSDQYDGNQSLLIRRGAPPPPPEEDNYPGAVQIKIDAACASSCEDEGKLHVEGNTLSTVGKGERGEPLRRNGASTNVSRPTDRIIDDCCVDAARENIDPETLLDLLDSALCCALDLLTFHEIEDDFAGRLEYLSKDQRKRAQKIIDRHKTRVEELDRSSGAPNEYQNVDELITPKLPRRHETTLSHLGVDRSQPRDRRSRRKERKSQSLSSWNARHRVAYRKSNAIDGIVETTSAEDQTEAGE